MAKNQKRLLVGVMLELGHLKWALYTRDGAREDICRWGGHFRQKGLPMPVQVSGLIKAYSESKEGDSGLLEGKKWGV